MDYNNSSRRFRPWDSRVQDGDITDTIQQRVTVYIERMFNDGYIDEKTKTYLLQTNVKPGRFYILPKIHETGNRPIVSSYSHPTERISEFVDYHINPLFSTLDSHIKDTTDFFNKLSNLGNLTFFLVCSKPTLSPTPLGGDISMIFSWSGQKVRIVWKYSSIISITFIPLLSSLALTYLLTFLFSTSWCLYITV